MSETAAENLRLAIKVTSFFVVLLGLVFLFSFVLAYVGKENNDPLGISDEPTGSQLVLDVLFIGLVFLTFVLPLLVLTRELQKRRQRAKSGQ